MGSPASRWLRPWAWMVAGAILGGETVLPVRAHEGPEEEIKQLTRRMEASGVTAPLLVRRATEYRALGKLKEAAADLRGALSRDPELREARVGLARILLAQDLSGEALDEMAEALARCEGVEARAGLHMVRAEIHLARGAFEKALQDCAEAFRHPQPDQEWYLMRSRAQRRLGRHAEAARDLRAGYERQGGHVLHEEWIEALIDAGQEDRALPEIEQALAGVRWRSSWLLRRGRARLAGGDEKGGRADLQAAVEEINRRLHPDRPDLTLLADRGLARALLGEMEAARSDLAAARRGGAPDWMTERLEALIKPGA